MNASTNYQLLNESSFQSSSRKTQDTKYCILYLKYLFGLCLTILSLLLFGYFFIRNKNLNQQLDQPKTDFRKYKMLSLYNDMKILIISDPETV